MQTKRRLWAPREFDDQGNCTEAYITWWATLTGNLPVGEKFRRNIRFGLKLDLPNYRSLIADIVGNRLMPIRNSQSDLSAGELERVRQTFISELHRAGETMIISGGLDPEAVRMWITQSESETWSKESVLHLYETWREISKPENLRQEQKNRNRA